MEFKDKLKLHREKQDLTLTDVAHLTGMSLTSLSRYESGERIPSKRSMTKIAQALDIDVEYLIDGIEHKIRDISDTADTIGMRIANTRKLNGMSQSTLADRLGYDRTTISKIETEGNNITVNNIIKIAEVLDVTPNYLITGEHEDPTDFIALELKRLNKIKSKEKRLQETLKSIDRLTEVIKED